MKRKLLLIAFTDDGCRQNHLFKYALDLKERGHHVKIILEGRATACLRRLGPDDPAFTDLFATAVETGLVHGTCQRATGGCGHPDAEKDGLALAREHGIALLSDLDGHAGIGAFVDQGFEIVVF